MEPRPQGDLRPVVVTASTGVVDLVVLRAQIEGSQGSGVVIAPDPSDVHPTLIAAATEGRPGITGRSCTDAVKRVDGGIVTESVDRDRVFLIELPIAVPRRHLVDRLAQLSSQGLNQVHPASLLTGLALDDVAFVDSGQVGQPQPAPNG